MEHSLKIALGVCFGLLACAANAQMTHELKIGGKKTGEVLRPANTGGGVGIQCDPDPNSTCCVVHFLTVNDENGPGTADIYENGKVVKTVEFGQMTKTPLDGSGRMEYGFLPKK